MDGWNCLTGMLNLKNQCNLICVKQKKHRQSKLFISSIIQFICSIPVLCHKTDVIERCFGCKISKEVSND